IDAERVINRRVAAAVVDEAVVVDADAIGSHDIVGIVDSIRVGETRAKSDEVGYDAVRIDVATDGRPEIGADENAGVIDAVDRGADGGQTELTRVGAVTFG